MTTNAEQWGRECAYCHNDFDPGSKGQRARFCSAKCRQAAYNARRRQRRRDDAAAEAAAEESGEPVAAHVISEVLTTHLEQLGAGDSVEGRAALTLAKRIDEYGAGESGSGLAALVRELRSSLAIVSPNPANLPHTHRDSDDAQDDDVVVAMQRARDNRRRRS